MEYYYLRNIDKARFYHNRMMNGELEKRTQVKEWNLEYLYKSRKLKAYKETLGLKSDFEQYKSSIEEMQFPHDDKRELKKLDNQFVKIMQKVPLISPKFEITNLKENLLKKALNKVLQAPKKDPRELENLQELSRSFNETIEKSPDISESWEHEYQLEKQKKILYSDTRVVSLANKYFQ